MYQRSSFVKTNNSLEDKTLFTTNIISVNE